jgi:hypothetical protein
MSLRSLEDAWCEYARHSLLQVAAVVRLLRVLAAAKTDCAAQPLRLLGLLVCWTTTRTMPVTTQQRRLLRRQIAGLWLDCRLS